MSNDDAIKMSEQLSTRTAGSLPSQRTKESCLIAPLASDDIDEVKSALLHIWLHYEALELAVSDRKSNYEVLTETHEAIAAGVIEDDVDDWDKVVTDGFLDGLVESAYTTAHAAPQMAQLFGVDITSSLQAFGFNHLDYSDPERELSDDELLKLSGQDDSDSSAS